MYVYGDYGQIISTIQQKVQVSESRLSSTYKVSERSKRIVIGVKLPSACYSIISCTGQWSLPVTSVSICESFTLGMNLSDTTK